MFNSEDLPHISAHKLVLEEYIDETVRHKVSLNQNHNEVAVKLNVIIHVKIIRKNWVQITININIIINCLGIAVAARSNARVYGSSLAGTAGSNPAGGKDVCLFVSVVCCQVEVSATG
jgi:hypothetical protein